MGTRVGGGGQALLLLSLTRWLRTNPVVSPFSHGKQKTWSPPHAAVWALMAFVTLADLPLVAVSSHYLSPFSPPFFPLPNAPSSFSWPFSLSALVFALSLAVAIWPYASPHHLPPSVWPASPQPSANPSPSAALAPAPRVAMSTMHPHPPTPPASSSRQASVTLPPPFPSGALPAALPPPAAENGDEVERAALAAAVDMAEAYYDWSVGRDTVRRRQ